ncbi:MAG: tRNA (guanine(10)-N(2))-dimethyltransferase [Candidatus Thermoplasmatota archaeon]|nr:tRNA (guanine(10)-N(2))-dimethyltransferase [Candidatus Thermoplasmatota archaeon]
MTKDVISQIREGITTIFVYDQQISKKGPGVRNRLPFYNPAMELNRDLSIAVAQWFLIKKKKHVHLLDGLAASGIRGVRFLHELLGDFEVTINDWSQDAFQLIQSNIRNISNGYANHQNIHTLLATNHYDYIDIDPFGSPASYIDSAIRGCKHQGVIACTATDTAALCGTYPLVCLRRYAATPLHGTCMHEIGLRILLGFLCKEAAKHDKGISPLLSYTTDHYMRVYIQIHNNINTANKSIQCYEQIPSKKIHSYVEKENRTIGPLWMGKLHDEHTLKEIRTHVFSKTLGTKKSILKLLELFEEEANAPAFFYTTDDISSQLKCSPPPLNTVLKNIESQGYPAYRTHFNPCGFKTLAPTPLIKDIFLQGT